MKSASDAKISAMERLRARKLVFDIKRLIGDADGMKDKAGVHKQASGGNGVLNDTADTIEVGHHRGSLIRIMYTHLSSCSKSLAPSGNARVSDKRGRRDHARISSLQPWNRGVGRVCQTDVIQLTMLVGSKRVEHVLDRLKKSTQAGDGSWGDKKTLQVRMRLHTLSSQPLVPYGKQPLEKSSMGNSEQQHAARQYSTLVTSAITCMHSRVSGARVSICAIVARACILSYMTVVVRQGVEEAMLKRNARKVAKSKRTAEDAAPAAAPPS